MKQMKGDAFLSFLAIPSLTLAEFALPNMAMQVLGNTCTNLNSSPRYRQLSFCGSVCSYNFPSVPGSSAGCSSGVRACTWQWQPEWYGLYIALTCIMGHVECSVQCQRQGCHSDRAVVSCWTLTDLALHQQPWLYSPKTCGLGHVWMSVH